LYLVNIPTENRFSLFQEFTAPVEKELLSKVNLPPAHKQRERFPIKGQPSFKYQKEKQSRRASIRPEAAL